MSHKKGSEAQSSDEEALQQRVDAMMKGDGPDLAKADAAPIDIFKDASTPVSIPVKEKSLAEVKTAPVVPDKLLKEIGKEPATKLSATKPPASTSEPASSAEGPEVEADDESDLDNPAIDDDATDKAVEDIVATEGDVVLAVEDAKVRHSNPQAKSSAGWKDKVRRLLKSRRTWIIVGVLLLIILVLPFTRYKLLGLAIKEPVTVTVIDSKTNKPVSSAVIRLAGVEAKTDANGKTKFRAAVGSSTLQITKQYYKPYTAAYFVGFKTATPSRVPLVATGRQVPVTVLNKITGKPLAGAEIKVLGTSAKTNAQGKATVVLPASAVSDSATVALNGYNKANVSVQVTSSIVSANTFYLTPVGHLYFLSNLGGNIDVVRSNLDGSGRHTVLAGTGKEDKNTTSLLASRDWKYLVLKAKRDTAQPALYLIDTSDDKVTEFDSGNANFTLVGWYGHNFIYDALRNNLSEWQSSREALKSYDAEHSQLNQLDQAQAEGNSSSYAHQGFANFYILNGLVSYTSQWYTYNASGSGYDVNGKTDAIRAISPTGQNKKDYQTFTTNTVGYIQATLYEPQAVYYAVYTNSDNKTTYYSFENQAVSTVTNIDQSDFNQSYPTFLLAPSSSRTFWTELRDGKNSLFIGDANAKGKKQVASLSDYSPYGWFSDDYTLVSKNSSQLYIMPASGLAAGKQPLKVTDYYKPAQTYNGYGYGYGGL